MEPVISVQDLAKSYRLYRHPIDRLKESFHPFGRKYHNDFHALEGVSFEIFPGESVGVIGKNGAGKSSLLKVLTGVLTPSSGAVVVRGKTSAILELGSGFNLEMSGLENLFFNGALMGLDKKTLVDRLDSILAFADIGPHIEQPVKTYSTGMFMRLAFALAVNTEPDILIVDEALSVGDVRFQLKCFQKIEEFQKRGVTLLFVSHSGQDVMRLCNRTLWLDAGRLRGDGPSKRVVEEYQAEQLHGASLLTVSEPLGPGVDSLTRLDPVQPGATITGDGGMLVQGIGLFDCRGAAASVLDGGQRVSVVYDVLVVQPVQVPFFAFQILSRQGIRVCGSNTFVEGTSVHPLNPGDLVRVTFEFDLPELENSPYVVAIGCNDGTPATHIRHQFIADARTFEMQSPSLRQTQAVLVKLKECSITVETRSHHG